MNTYAVVGYLDSKTETYFKDLWINLSDRNISKYGVEAKGKRPHITIADYDNLELKSFIKLMDRFYEDKQKLDITLSILGTFINTGTLFIAPTLSGELLGFHKDHHNCFKLYNRNDDSLYLPGRWSPHCTIASRLNEDEMIEAFRYCKNKINRIPCKINQIALIELNLNDCGVAIEDKIIFSKELK